MNQGIKDTVDIVSKLAAAAGIVLAALNYRNQTKTKRAEWLRSLFEKFYEANNLKEARKWIESGEIEKRIDVKNTISADEEKLADYLNFFEFIATLESDKQLKY